MKRRRRPDPPPAYLEARAEVRVRFQEVDSLRIVWHGHYVAYLEEAREALGRRYGLSYEDVRAAGYAVPLVHVELDYIAPAAYGDVLTVTARLHPESAARLTYTYLVAGPSGERLATGLTVQAFTDLQTGKAALTRPAFYDAWVEQHRAELQGE